MINVIEKMIGKGNNELSEEEKYRRAIKEYKLREEDAQLIPGKPVEIYVRDDVLGKDGILRLGFEEIHPFDKRWDEGYLGIYKKDPRIVVKVYYRKWHAIVPGVLYEADSSEDYATIEYRGEKFREIGRTTDILCLDEWEIHPEIVETAIQEIKENRISSVTQLLIDMVKDQQELERWRYHSKWRLLNNEDDWQLGPERKYDDRELCNGFANLLNSKNHNKNQ